MNGATFNSFKRKLKEILANTEFKKRTDFIAKELWQIKNEDAIDYDKHYRTLITKRIDLCKALLSIKKNNTKSISINDPKGEYDIPIPEGFEQLLENDFSKENLDKEELSYEDAQLLMAKDDEWHSTYWQTQLTPIISIFKDLDGNEFIKAHPKTSETARLENDDYIYAETTKYVQQWEKEGCTHDKLVNNLSKKLIELEPSISTGCSKKLLTLVTQELIIYLEKKIGGNLPDSYDYTPSEKFIKGIKGIINNVMNGKQSNKFEIDLVEILTKQYWCDHSFETVLPITIQLIESRLRESEESIVIKRGAPPKKNKMIEVLGFIAFYQDEDTLWLPLPDKIPSNSMRAIFESLKLAGIITDDVDSIWEEEDREQKEISHIQYIAIKARKYHNSHTLP